MISLNPSLSLNKNLFLNEEQPTAYLSNASESFRLFGYPRVSLRRFLPAVFGEDPTLSSFLDRFLSIFDTTMRSVEREIDNQARYFDPASAPATSKPGIGTPAVSSRLF